MAAGGTSVGGSGRILRLVTAVAIASGAACKPPPDTRWTVDAEAAKRGRAVVEKVQCAACHEIEGIEWPKGMTGPSLATFDDRGMIAGSLPNRPDVLAAFVRNAPGVKPGSPMPPMPISQREAEEVAAFLYENGR